MRYDDNERRYLAWEIRRLGRETKKKRERKKREREDERLWHSIIRNKEYEEEKLKHKKELCMHTLKKWG